MVKTNKTNKSVKKNEKQKDKPKKAVTTTATLAKAIVVGSAACLGLVVANLGMLWNLNKSKTEVIAITETGQIIKPIPLPQAFVTDSRVLSYVDTCLRESFSHDFEHFRKTVNASMQCYTQSGGELFKKELERNLKIIQEKRLVMSITLEPPSVIRGPYLQNGRATWEVQTIITIFYQGAKEKYLPQVYRANVTVLRVPLEENITGISLNSIQLRPTSTI